MATRMAAANSAWLTSTTWATIDSTSFSNSESANTALTTSYVESSTFTPGAITVDGVAVKIASRAGSPTGTMSVHLAIAGVEVTGSAVTVNISDIPTCSATSGTTTPVDTAEGGWFFVKFAAPLLLLGATLYSVGAKTSSSSQVNLWSSATTNWSRALRTTTTGNMASGDDAIITGEWTAAATVTARTVTMDETTATDYGNNTTTQVTPAIAICKNGALVWAVGATTNYNLKVSGYIIVYNGGSYLQGSSGNEIPRGSTATTTMDCGTAGDFGIVGRNLSIVSFYGLSRTSGNNTVIAKLAANAAAAATALTTDVNTGWLNTDSVCYAPTSRTFSEFEKKALTADAVTTSLTSAALTNAHSGTSPTQAEVGLLTRNNVFTATTAAKGGFIFCGSTCIFTFSFSEGIIFGVNATNKRGIVLNTTTGSCLIDHASIHDNPDNGVTFNTTNMNNVTIQYTVFYNCTVPIFNGSATLSGGYTIDHCMFCGSSASSNLFWGSAAASGTITNSSFSGCNVSTAAIFLINVSTMIAFSGNEVHSNSGTGLLTGSPWYGTIASCNFWRNNSNGCTINGGQSSTNSAGLSATVSNSNFFGNNGDNLNLNFSQPVNMNIILDTCTFNGDTTFSSSGSIGWALGVSGFLYMYSCKLGQVTGIKTQCTSSFDMQNSRSLVQVFADNCIINDTNLMTNAPNFYPSNINVPWLQVQNFGQTANDNRSYTYTGATTVNNVMQSDSGTVHGTDPLSQKMTPGTASFKMRGTPFYIKANSGQTPTVGVYVQKNGSYNGAAPRLISMRQDSMGVVSDVVAATFSASASTWQQLTYVCPAAPQDGVFAFCIDCDGTAGAIFVGDWSQA